MSEPDERAPIQRRTWSSGGAGANRSSTGSDDSRVPLGGVHDEVSKHPACNRAYACSTALNYKHQLFAWLSLCSVAFADIYVRLCSMGIWSDVRIF